MSTAGSDADHEVEAATHDDRSGVESCLVEQHASVEEVQVQVASTSPEVTRLAWVDLVDTDTNLSEEPDCKESEAL